MENGHVRDFSEFCDQLNDIRLKFHKFDNCERTVGLYYLMVGLPFANAKFLQYALEQCVNSVNTLEAQCLEKNANDPEYIAGFLQEPSQTALTSLLKHLPLLKPNNKKAADCYLRIIQQVLRDFIAPPLKIYNDCVEIMSYVYIHPAFNNEDKKSFKQLLTKVLTKISPPGFNNSPTTESSDESVSPNPESQQNLKQRRSHSLTIGQVTYQENLPSSQDNRCSNENLNEAPCKQRSFSLSSETSLLSGVPGLQASRSETGLQDLKLMNNNPSMKCIVSWLKSLRLHKYSWVFNNLTYTQMLKLTEDDLQKIGITKGARHKIILSIHKLKERSENLTELEIDVMNGGDLNAALKKLKNILQTPLHLTLGEDLASQFVKVMGKVCTQILMLRQHHDDYLMQFGSLCDRADTLDAFTDEQKRRLNVWKGQLLKEDSVTTLIHRDQNTNGGYRSQMNGRYQQKNRTTSQNTYTKKSSSFPNMKHNHHPWNTHRHSVGSLTLQNQLFSPSPQPPTTNQNCVGHDRPRKPRGDCSVSINHFNLKEFKMKQEQIAIRSADIESSLESLCIQMMEHALGP
nr:protein Smaug homolog 1 [Leptinotarsa decemlineata]